MGWGLPQPTELLPYLYLNFWIYCKKPYATIGTKSFKLTLLFTHIFNRYIRAIPFNTERTLYLEQFYEYFPLSSRGLITSFYLRALLQVNFTRIIFGRDLLVAVIQWYLAECIRDWLHISRAQLWLSLKRQLPWNTAIFRTMGIYSNQHNQNITENDVT